MPALAAVLVIALTVSLGNWQMRRAGEKAALQQAQEAADRAAPRVLGAEPVAPDALDGRRVVATGRWVPQATVFLDNRTHQGRAGFQVFTPLRLEGERPMHLLVLRGWVARDPVERTRLPAVPAQEGRVRVEGIAQARLPGALRLGSDDQAREGPQGRIWQSVSLDAFAQWSSLALQPVILRQTVDSGDGLVRERPQPGEGAQRHHGYAVQWYAMAAATALLWLYFGWFRRNGKSDVDA